MRVLLLVAVWVGVCGVGPPEPLAAMVVQGELEGRVEGVVLDAETRGPVANALVELLGTDARAETDAEGRFVLEGPFSGWHTLRVSHLAYGVHQRPLDVDDLTALELRLSPSALELQPLTVNVTSPDERERRARGFGRNLVGRDEIEKSIPTSRHLGDVLRGRIPGIRITEDRSLAGSGVCVEFRGANQSELFQVGCNAPKVYLDGVPVSSPVDLFTHLSLEQVEEIEVIPPSEAGAQYGGGAQYGVMLIRTQRPGVDRSGRGSVDEQEPVEPGSVPVFDWTLDPDGHSWGRVAAGGVAGSLVGLGLGIAVGRFCIEINERDEIDSTCGATGTAAAGLAAVSVPAVLAAWGAGWGGRTDQSEGRFWPAAAAAGMALAPGYAFALAQRGSGSPARTAGQVLLLVGVPALVTLADHWFRRLR